MKKIIYSILFLTTCFGYSQTENDREKIKSSYNQKNVESLKKEVFKYSKERKKRVNNLIAKNNITDQDFINSLYDVIDNNLIFRATENVNASLLTRTLELNTGGSLGLNLNGEEHSVGVWDEKRVMVNHDEFKLVDQDSKVTIGDSGNSFGGHGTHVAGTIGAYGINPNAKGMAPEVEILTYDWQDDIAEVLAAANEGLLISNHSYGIPIFNNQGNLALPAAYVGAYMNDAYYWDYLVHQLDYILPVMSAGNEGVPNNSQAIAPGYDKLFGNKVSKNLLIVANSFKPYFDEDTNERLTEATINPSSSEGPTDDGRVKPDIAGMGSNLESSYYFVGSPSATDGYATLTGTSMSTPNVAGSLILLQQYNNELYSEHLKSFELKNLAIHTVYDPQSPSIGPDPKFGWGVLDAYESALVIQNKNNSEIIFESHELSDGQTISYDITVSEDSSVKASIVWNDIAGKGTASSPGNSPTLNDPTPALVNDLDMRIINNDTDEEYMPWVLDMSSTPIAAIKADNNVDNVEKIEVNNLPAGNYTIEISHKGSLVAGDQEFSLIVTGIDSFLSTENIISQNEIKIWPNPVKNYLNITGAEAFEGQAEVKVYDLSGRLVLSSTKNSTSQNTIQMNTSSLSTGTYLVKITDGKTSLNKKIIKE